MSVTLDKTKNRTAQTVDRPLPRLRTTPRLKPAPQPKTHVNVRVRVVEQKRVNVAGIVALQTALFLAVFGMTYVGMVLMGQVKVEKARRAELAAKERAIEARRAESEIRARVDALRSAQEIKRWAVARSFVAPGAQDAPKTKA